MMGCVYLLFLVLFRVGHYKVVSHGTGVHDLGLTGVSLEQEEVGCVSGRALNTDKKRPALVRKSNILFTGFY